MLFISLTIVVLSIGSCLSLPALEYDNRPVSNNSFFWHRDIGASNIPLNCVTSNEKCCNGSEVAGWRDERGRPFNQGVNGASCLYVTTGDGVISLNRKLGCSDHTPGLWRCDIPDSSGEIQSLYVYISNNTNYGQLNRSVDIFITIHTEFNARVPEFTISCHTHGGPATTVQWIVNGVSVQEDSDHETSQIILDTSLNSVYDNRLRVRGKRYGIYNCSVSNNIRYFLNKMDVFTTIVNGSLQTSVTGEPTSVTAVISQSNSTHVNISVSWESPGDAVTDYLIYYWPEGGPSINNTVFEESQIEKHSLSGLQRGITYSISIIAFSHGLLPSEPVEPVIVVCPLMIVETSPESLNTTSTEGFTVTCTVRAEIDGENVSDVVIEWEDINTTLEACNTTEVSNRCVLNITELRTVNPIIIYHCTATYMDCSESGDTTVYVEDIHITTAKAYISTSGVTSALTAIVSSPRTMNTNSSGITISFTPSMTPLNMNSSASIIGMTSDTMKFSKTSTIYLDFSSSSEITFISTLSSKYAESRATPTVTPILSFSGDSLSSCSTITIYSSVAAPSTVAILSSEISSFATITVPSIEISSFSTPVLTVPSSVTSNTEVASNIGPTILSSSNQTSFVSIPSSNMISMMITPTVSSATMIRTTTSLSLTILSSATMMGTTTSLSLTTLSPATIMGTTTSLSSRAMNTSSHRVTVTSLTPMFSPISKSGEITILTSPLTSSTGITVATPPEDETEYKTEIIVGVVCAVVTLTTFVFVVVVFKIRDKRKDGTRHKSPPHEMTVFGGRESGWFDTSYEEESNMETMPIRSDIPVREFPEYVMEMTAEDDCSINRLAREFSKIPSAPASAYRVACLPHNEASNRFRNIFPYDNSRVCLTEIPGEIGSDYINASFISGYKGSSYIAAQAPLDNTIDQFWRMVWECNVEAIIMLAKCVEMGREKSAMYWPGTLNETVNAGECLSISLSSSTPYAEYHVRNFRLKHHTMAKRPVTVTQFHYTAWPDHGVPDNVMSIIHFIRHIRKLFPPSQEQPLLVHCSAGVGRTGTFIALDTMIQQMKVEGTISICQCIRNLRSQRMKMVQSQAQYDFIHYSLSELVVCGETEMTASHLRSFIESLRDEEDDNSNMTYLTQNLQILESLFQRHKWNFAGAKARENVNKNRFPNKLPNEVYRVRLMCEGTSGADYINASFVNGYQQRDAYIATQGPLENTVEDFWRMMWEYQCGCIVMLCQLEEDGQESSYLYWPAREGEETVYGRLSVKLLKVTERGDIVLRKLSITAEHFTDVLIVRMIQLTSWPPQGLPHPSAITSLIDKLTNALMASSSKQTVVMCSDGVVRSGTFLVIHSQLERLKTEGLVDVFQAVKAARIQRPGVIPNIEHYVFCYEVLADFVEKMEAYYNFKTLM